MTTIHARIVVMIVCETFSTVSSGLRTGDVRPVDGNGRIRFVFAAWRETSSGGGARKGVSPEGREGRRTSRMCLG